MTTINQAWLNKNQKKAETLYDSGLDYLDTSSGAFQSLRVLSTGLGAIEQTGELSANLSKFKGTLGAGLGVFAIPRLPGETVDTIKSVAELRKDDGIKFSRKFTKAVQNLASAITTYIDCISLITPLAGVKNLARGLGFTYSATGLQMTVADYTRASSLESVATGEAKVALKHTKTHLLLKLIKSIASIAGSILGIGMLIAGYALLPAVAILVISATSLFFGIAADLYKPMGRYPLIKFDREVKLA